jgi:hypothetical protein
MENIIQKLQNLNIDLSDAISYEDWDLVEEVRKEITFLIGELDMDSPISKFDDEY